MAVIPGNTLAAYNTDRFPSGGIWGDFPMDVYYAYPGQYFHWFDDFHNCFDLSGGSTPATDGLQQPYATYIDTSDTVRALAVTYKNRGILRLLTTTTDNNAPVITMQGNRGYSFILDDNTVADTCPFWFEARWQKSSITANQAAIFIGLTEEARAVNDGVLTDDSGVLITTISGIGFRVLQADGSLLDFTYQKGSQANQSMNSIISTTNSASGALVITTFYKTGFKYNHAFDADKRTKVYVNNKEYTTYITGTQMAAATFPDGVGMTFTAALKNGEATACSFDLDWIRLAQKMLAV